MIKNCAWCGEPIHPELPGQTRYDTDSCRWAAKYDRAKKRGYFDRRYQQIKKAYRLSRAGRQGISLHAWMRLPYWLKKERW